MPILADTSPAPEGSSARPTGQAGAVAGDRSGAPAENASTTDHALRELADLLRMPEQDVAANAHSLLVDSLALLELAVRLDAHGRSPAIERLSSGATVADVLEALARAPAPTAAPAAGQLRLRLPPTMRGLRVSLTPVLPRDTDFLYSLAISEETGFRWRYRGSAPSYETFQGVLWEGIAAQFLVRDQAGVPVGHAIVYNADFNLGLAHIGIALVGPLLGTGVGVEATRLLLHHAFSTWTLRICYLELPEYNYAQFASGEGRVFLVEGRLHDAEVYGGRYYDRLILAISRERFYQDETIERAPGL
jgi:RimJ/RimL family protein N-acetyltransferase